MECVLGFAEIVVLENHVQLGTAIYPCLVSFDPSPVSFDPCLVSFDPGCVTAPFYDICSGCGRIEMRLFIFLCEASARFVFR